MTLVWIVLGAVGLFAVGWLNAIRATLVREWRLAKLIQPAIDSLREDRPDVLAKIAEFAELPTTRNHLFTTLKEMGRTDVFPAAFRTVEKAAESDLTCWLMHANELGTAPAQMEFVRAIPIQEDAKTGSFLLFRFRVDSSHWAFQHGWMAGVAGPYWTEGELPDVASGTFSELKPFDSMTEKQHVEYLQQALNRKGFVVRS